MDLPRAPNNHSLVSSGGGKVSLRGLPVDFSAEKAS